MNSIFDNCPVENSQRMTKLLETFTFENLNQVVTQYQKNEPAQGNKRDMQRKLFCLRLFVLLGFGDMEKDARVRLEIMRDEIDQTYFEALFSGHLRELACQFEIFAECTGSNECTNLVHFLPKRGVQYKSTDLVRLCEKCKQNK